VGAELQRKGITYSREIDAKARPAVWVGANAGKLEAERTPLREGTHDGHG
jgi:hypothetical protein